MSTKKTVLLGAHMSGAGGLENAITAGESIGCTAIQLFTKSNQQWHAKELTQEQIDRFITTRAASTIQSIIAHACYLINIASTDTALVNKSISALALELERCRLLQIDALVLHPGAYTTTTIDDGIAQAANSINRALSQTKSGPLLLIESMAGQGTTIGSSIEQLAAILDKIHHHERVGICIDTCHIFAAGYSWETEELYEQFWHTVNRLIGINKVHTFHLNDSAQDLGSNVDRHSDIGKGKMGLEPFKLLLNDTRFDRVPKILETPKTKGLAEDIKNLKTLIHLFDADHKALVATTTLARYL